MGYKKNRSDRGTKPRRRSKTAPASTGSTEGLVQVRLDAKTIIFCRPEEVKRATAKWEKKQAADFKALHVPGNFKSRTREGRKAAKKKTVDKYYAKRKTFAENSPF